MYRADQLALGREVAVKVVPAEGVEEALINRFKREAQAAAAIEHPAVVPIYAAGEQDGLLYLVMRLVHGIDLGALVRHTGPLGPARAIAFVEQVAGALDAIHRAGLVHRDVKPANILIEGKRAYLSDFGLMRHAVEASPITRTGEWVGTADYAAPEQLEARTVDARTDVYALTGVLYTALTGRPPFVRDSPAATALAHVTAAPPRLARQPALSVVIGTGMAKDPAERYRSAGELATAARTALQPNRARRRALALVGAVLVAVGAAAAVVAEVSGSRSRASASSAPFGFAHPAGWRMVEDERPLGGFLRTRLLSPDGSEMVIIDRTPVETVALAAWATGVERATAGQTSGYRRVSFGPAKIAGRAAFVWTFVVAGDSQPARVDVFQRIGPSGFAVLGEGTTVAQIAPVTLAIARSLRTR